MTGQRFALFTQPGGAPETVVILVVAAVMILVAVLGAAYVGRTQIRRRHAESAYATLVFEQIMSREPDDATFITELSARRRTRSLATGPVIDDLAAISRTAMQEAEIYLEHHRLALRHHSAYQQASLWSGLLGFSVILVGAALTYFVGLDTGIVTAVAGVIPAAAGRLLFRQADVVGRRAAENLRALEESVRRYSALQAALAAADEIGDRQARNRMYEMIGLHMLFPGDKLETLLRNQAKAAGTREKNGND